MVFYAYAKTATDDWSYRYLIVFASRTVADEWWRTVEDSSVRGTTFAALKRMTPQFYVHNPLVGNIVTTITNPNCAPKFIDRVMFTLLSDRDGRALSVIPNQDIKDHVSGDTFFIRSKANPDSYWGLCDGKVCELLEGRGTPFILSIAGERQPGRIMIPSDNVEISIAGRPDITLVFQDRQLVVYNQSSSTASAIFKFRDFDNGFMSIEEQMSGNGGAAWKGSAVGPVVNIPSGENGGRSWELV